MYAVRKVRFHRGFISPVPPLGKLLPQSRMQQQLLSRKGVISGPVTLSETSSGATTARMLDR